MEQHVFKIVLISIGKSQLAVNALLAILDAKLVKHRALIALLVYKDFIGLKLLILV